MKKAVQQIMLGTVTGNESRTRETLQRIKAAGYDGLELNRFMIHPSSLMVRMMTRAAGGWRSSVCTRTWGAWSVKRTP